MRNTQRDALVGYVLRELAAIEPRLNEAHTNCRDWHASGYPTTSLPQIGSSGVPTDRTGNSAMQPDTFAVQANEADRLLQIAHDAVAYLVAFVNDNTVLRQGIHCGNVNCDRIMTGKGNDSPRGPMRECPRCAIHRRRHNTPWPHQSVTTALHDPVDNISAPVTLPPDD